MRRRLRTALLRLPGGVGYRLAGPLHVRKSVPAPRPFTPGMAPADRASHSNASGTGKLTVELEQQGRSKRLRVRDAGDIWSDDFRAELARDRRFEASLAWRELVILVFIAVILALRTIAG
jgi:hypothetical protein